MRWIEAVTDPALSRLDVDELVHELLTRVRRLLDVDTATVLLLDPAARQLVATHAVGIEEEVQQGIRVPWGEGFAGRVAASGEVVELDHVDETTVVNSLLWEKGLRAMLGVPMVGLGRLIGVAHVGSLTQRRFTDDEVHLLRMVADRIALAANAQMASADRAAVSALQRSLLPARLPMMADLEFAARYVPGTAQGVGGDWYDVFPLPGDRLGIVIGDVMGHGLPAAVIMGRLRSALRAYALLEVDDPAQVLDRLDRKAVHFEASAMATVAYAVVDARHESLTLAVSGHPPPVLAVPGEQVKLVDIDPNPPIGLRHKWPHRNHTVRLPVGAVMGFYTDGLVERRGLSIDVGLDRLCAVPMSGPVDQVCSRIMRTLVGDLDSPEDDTALLVMRRHAGRH